MAQASEQQEGQQPSPALAKPDPETLELEQKMAKALKEGNPESWQWDRDGMVVMGYAVRKEMGRTKYGPAEILVLTVRGTLRSVWIVHEVLKNQLYRKQPRVGDFVGIQNLGERQPESGGPNTYIDFAVQVIPQGTGDDQPTLAWDSPPQLAPGEPVEAEVVSEPAPAGDWGGVGPAQEWPAEDPSGPTSGDWS